MLRKMIVAATLLASTSLPAQAGPAQVITSPPGAIFALGYTSPVVVVSRSRPVTYVNFDVLWFHNVEATDTYGDGTDYWCVEFPVGRCPVFWSPWRGTADPVEVEGIGRLDVGKTYAFRCAPHPGMRGLLAVVE